MYPSAYDIGLDAQDEETLAIIMQERDDTRYCEKCGREDRPLTRWEEGLDFCDPCLEPVQFWHRIFTTANH